MTTTRRDFLGQSATLGGALALGWPAPLPAASLPAAPPPRRAALRILFLGGTGFIGPHMVQAALDRGHTPTLFNRGRTNPQLFPGVEKLEGDRDGGLDVLRGRTWDAVVDTSGYVPRLVRDSAQLLRDGVPHYYYISTTDAYRTYNISDMDEDAPLAVLPDNATEEVGRYYGPLKAQCEREVRAIYPASATIVRPTWIVGPGDRATLFAYWLERVHGGGAVLAPGDPTDPTQIIDARDLGEWTIRLLENRTFGTYNAVGPEAQLSFAEFLYGIRAITSANVVFTWVDADFLAEQQAYPWREIPIWWPPRENYPGSPTSSIQGGSGFGLISRQRAIAAGLTYRPLAVTAKDTLDWILSDDPFAGRRRSGLTREREAELLALWHARRPR